MAQRGLTELLKAHHDKLNQHTTELHDIQTKITALAASVSKLEEQAGSVDQASGARAGLRDWLKSIRDLL